MLDFYLINDDQTKPSSPEQLDLKYVGGLADETFENLQCKNIIDARFDYYTDFRWTTTIIKQLRETISKKQMQADTDIQQLIKLLDLADKNKNGLIAFAD
jgi:hypothetical protein